MVETRSPRSRSAARGRSRSAKVDGGRQQLQGGIGSKNARSGGATTRQIKDEEAELSSGARSQSRSPRVLKSSKSSGLPPAAESPDYLAYSLAAALLFITIYMYPSSADMSRHMQHGASLSYVFYHGWLTAVSTGLGVLPFYFVSEPNQTWVGICNSVAAGMMTAAAYSLAYEGGTSEASTSVSALAAFPTSIDTPLARTLFGFVCGILFIVATGKVLETREDLSVGSMVGASAQKMVLIMFVMTLHSLTEGIGIGVSFGGPGQSGLQLGQFISTSLAIHNIPEGLAVALVLFPMRISMLRTCLWAVFTSLPQPLMAMPAFLFVQEFQPLLPVGLGFASGAMAYVAVFELLREAVEDVRNKPLVLLVMGGACVAMMTMQSWLHGDL
eukprot:GSChrysophyteH2.ASY1.ANO1.1031.1 assembled CDS